MDNFIQIIYDIVWSPALVILLICAGLYFSFRTRFVQVRRFGLMIRMMFRNAETGKGFSPYQALCVSISGRVGTGNIVGVATAIAIGGPGSVFWMWLIAFLGAATAFTESTLAQIYKFPCGKSFRGGPAAYIDKGLRKPGLGIVFAVLTIIGYGALLILVQSNSVASAFNNSMGLPTWCSGTILAFFTALVIIGGAKRISKVAEIVAPAMALGYILMALIVIFANYERIPEAFCMIFSSAFGLGPAAGGAIGTTISMGVKRGLFSNEAGQGGGAIVSAGAVNEVPAQQGLVQAFSVYIDTLLICTATALMILCSGVYDDTTIGSNFVAYTQRAIDTIFRDFGSGFIAFSLWLFVFTSLMAYYYYAESSLIYLFEKHKSLDRKTGKKIVWVYRILFVAIIFLGSQTSSKTAWTLGDIGVGLTTWINVIALFFLFPQALNALKDCEKLYPSKRKCSKEK